MKGKIKSRMTDGHVRPMPLALPLLAALLLFGACAPQATESDLYNRMFAADRLRVMYSGNEQAVDDARKMLAHAEQHASRYGKVLAYLSLTSLAAQSGDYDNMSRYMEVARASLDMSDPPFLQGYAYFVEGTVDFSTTLSVNSQLCYDKALRYFKPLGDSLMVASCYINKCNCHFLNLNSAAASACVDSARRWAPPSYRYTLRTYEAMLQNYLDHPREAAQIYAAIVSDAMSDTTLPSRPSPTSARFWTILYSNYIFASLHAGDHDAAQAQCHSLDSIATAFGSEFDRSNCRLMQAWIEAAEGRIDSALAICNDIYKNYRGFHQLAIHRSVVDLMVQCYTEQENYQKALEFSNIKTSLSARRMADARVLDEIVDRQQGYENHIRNLELRAAQVRIWMLLIGILFIISLATLLLYRQNRRLKERQSRVRELENEQRLREQQVEIDSARMEQATTREQMASFAGEVRRIAYDMPKNQRAKLLMGISRMEEQQQRDSWDEFAEGFARQNPSFVAWMELHAASLAPIETKICMLIRAGLSNREIADTLHLADNTIRTYRVRIRKKLSVPEGADLNAFISDLSEG